MLWLPGGGKKGESIKSLNYLDFEGRAVAMLPNNSTSEQSLLKLLLSNNKNIARSQKPALKNLIGCGGVKLCLLKYVTITTVTTAIVTNVTHTTVTITIATFSTDTTVTITTVSTITITTVTTVTITTVTSTTVT